MFRLFDQLAEKFDQLIKRFKKEEEIVITIDDIESIRYPTFSVKGEVIEEYDIEPPFSKVKITLEPDGTLLYNLLEPNLPVSYTEFEQLRRAVFLKASKYSAEPSIEDIFKAFIDVIKKKNFTIEQIGAIWYHLINRSLKAGKITALLLDHNIEDVTCNGYDLPVYVYHRKYGYLKTNIIFDRDELDDFVSVVAQRSGLDLTYTNPIIDTQIYDGSNYHRINITFRNIVSSRGTTFTIRKVKKSPITPTQLIASGTFSKELMTLLWMAMDYNCSCMFIGETASGKTTSLNAVALFIPHSSKIVSIEDTREIHLPHENWTPLVVTPPLVDAFVLVTTTLRQRPEYIIVGEARGKEVTAMFQAMALGHPCLTTMHAADIYEIINRITAPPLEVPVQSLPLLNFVIVVKNIGSRESPFRRCTGAYLINDDGMGEEVLKGIFVYKFVKYNYKEDTHTIDLETPLQFLEEKTGKPVEDIKMDFSERLTFIEKLLENNVMEMGDFCKSLKEFKYERLRGALNVQSERV